MSDTFWTQIKTQLTELESAQSADDVLLTLAHDRNPYGLGWDGAAGDGFFAGSGGYGSVWAALDTAGWEDIWGSAIHYVMRAPDGSMITYCEGDVYRGDRR